MLLSSNIRQYELEKDITKGCISSESSDFDFACRFRRFRRSKNDCSSFYSWSRTKHSSPVSETSLATIVFFIPSIPLTTNCHLIPPHLRPFGSVTNVFAGTHIHAGIFDRKFYNKDGLSKSFF